MRRNSNTASAVTINCLSGHRAFHPLSEQHCIRIIRVECNNTHEHYEGTSISAEAFGNIS